MNIQREINTLQEQLDKLKEMLEKEKYTQKQKVIPTEEDIGKLVMHRDLPSDDWNGPDVLKGINPDEEFCFQTDGENFTEAKLYLGPVKLHMQPWDGVDPAGPALPDDQRVLVKLGCGRYHVDYLGDWTWEWLTRGEFSDIVAFCPIDVE